MDGSTVGRIHGTITAIDAGTGEQTFTADDTSEILLAVGVAVKNPKIGRSIWLSRSEPHAPWVAEGLAVAADDTEAQAIAAPNVTSITATTGDIAGDEEVTISGTGFYEPIDSIEFEIGTAVAAADITSVTPTEIVCKTPAHAAGTVDLVVTIEGVADTLATAYEYTDV